MSLLGGRCEKLSEFVHTRLKLVDGYEFKVEFDVEGVPELIVDEVKPVGKNFGPNPRRLLSAAVGHCLSSSFLFCLRKAGVDLKDLETNVKMITEKNEGGYLRIKRLDIQISLSANEEDESRVDRCREIFENFSVVTQSVRKGIEVNVAINNANEQKINP